MSLGVYPIPKQLFLETSIPEVLDLVICSPWQVTSYDRPPEKHQMHQKPIFDSIENQVYELAIEVRLLLVA